MKRYRITSREVWMVTREVEACDSFNPCDLFLEGEEVKRVFVKLDEYTDENSTEEIQNEDTRN